MLINVPDDVTVLAVADFADSIGCEILPAKGMLHLVRSKKTEENKTANSENPPKSKPFESAIHTPKHANGAEMAIFKGINGESNDPSR